MISISQNIKKFKGSKPLHSPYLNQPYPNLGFKGLFKREQTKPFIRMPLKFPSEPFLSGDNQRGLSQFPIRVSIRTVALFADSSSDSRSSLTTSPERKEKELEDGMGRYRVSYAHREPPSRESGASTLHLSMEERAEDGEKQRVQEGWEEEGKRRRG